MELDRKLWLTADKERVVEDGDPEAAFLLGNEGTEIPDEEARRLGIKGRKAKVEDKAADAPENKAAAADEAKDEAPAKPSGLSVTKATATKKG